jgi:hypothetical protein
VKTIWRTRTMNCEKRSRITTIATVVTVRTTIGKSLHSFEPDPLHFSIVQFCSSAIWQLCSFDNLLIFQSFSLIHNIIVHRYWRAIILSSSHFHFNELKYCNWIKFTFDSILYIDSVLNLRYVWDSYENHQYFSKLIFDQESIGEYSDRLIGPRSWLEKSARDELTQKGKKGKFWTFGNAAEDFDDCFLSHERSQWSHELGRNRQQDDD